jgi:hypothetical protein
LQLHPVLFYSTEKTRDSVGICLEDHSAVFAMTNVKSFS